MVVAWLASRVLGIPLSVTLHGSDVLVAPSPRLGEALRDADRIVCVSEHMRRTVESRYSVDPDKTAVIHCGIDPEEFPCSPRISPDLRILSVARLHPVKGLADLVSACGLLRDRGVSFHCSIVGEGPERSRLEAQVNACGLNNQVRFLGALPNEKLPAVYRDHSLFVLPSYSEGMPVVLMEAMATGLPVIASRVGGIPEMIKDGANGILIEPNSPAMIAQAVIDLQRKPLEEIDAMRMRNRKEIVADFNVRFEVEKLYRIFAQPSSRRAV